MGHEPFAAKKAVCPLAPHRAPSQRSSCTVAINPRGLTTFFAPLSTNGTRALRGEKGCLSPSSPQSPIAAFILYGSSQPSGTDHLFRPTLHEWDTSLRGEKGCLSPSSPQSPIAAPSSSHRKKAQRIIPLLQNPPPLQHPINFFQPK